MDLKIIARTVQRSYNKMPEPVKKSIEEIANKVYKYARNNTVEMIVRTIRRWGGKGDGTKV